MELKSSVNGVEEVYTFRSDDGVQPKDRFDSGELALSNNVDIQDEGDILIAQSGFGFLPVVLSRMAAEGSIVAAETSDRAYQLTKINIRENNVENVSCTKLGFYSELDKKFDQILYSPRDYTPVAVVKSRLSNLIERLHRGGEIFIAGRKNGGVKRYSDFLNSQKGSTKKIAQDGSERVYRYRKTERFTPEKIDIEKEFSAELNNIKADFKTCEGLFSSGELDHGTELLLEQLGLSEGEEVLDLACGYGAISVFVVSLFNVSLFLTDDDMTSVHYARENLKANNVDYQRIENCDCLDGFDRSFDTIISNPPTHQGSSITKEMFEESYRKLRPGGKLYLVYNQNMKFEEQLDEKFETTEVLEKKDNFLVLKASKQA